MLFWHKRFICLFLLIMTAIAGVVACKKEDEPAAVSHEREKVPEEVSGKREEINFRLVDDETLEVSGYGEWKEVDDQYWYEYDEKNKYQIRTLIVKEGITKISLAGTRMEYVQEIFLPDSVKEIGERAFWGFSNLRRVSFGNGLKKIGKGAFEGCQFLKQALLPDSLEEIGAYAFEDDIRLEKIVIPSSLLQWDKSAIRRCPSLKEVENHSALSCEMYQFGKCITWLVNGKEVKKIPARNTGSAVGTKIPVCYDLNGGKACGILPQYYQFGTEIKLPDCVKKKGHEFICWCDDKLGFFVDTIEPGRKKASVAALWFRTYTVESRKKGEVMITVDTTGSCSGYEGFDIRYSASEDMSHALYLPEGIINKGSRKVENLKSGDTYYFQVGGWGDSEWTEEADDAMNDQDWMGKRKVVVK